MNERKYTPAQVRAIRRDKITNQKINAARQREENAYTRERAAKEEAVRLRHDLSELREQNERLNKEAALKTELQRELIALRTMFINLQEQHDTKARDLQDEKITLYLYRIAFWSLVVFTLFYAVFKNV
jgi:cell shape-determining protein MreC